MKRPRSRGSPRPACKPIRAEESHGGWIRLTVSAAGPRHRWATLHQSVWRIRPTTVGGWRTHMQARQPETTVRANEVLVRRQVWRCRKLHALQGRNRRELVGEQTSAGVDGGPCRFDGWNQ